MAKLVKAEFTVSSVEDTNKVVDAFCAAFPSLDGVRGEDLASFLFTGKMPQSLADALEEASCNGRWPGEAVLVGKNHGNGWRTSELMLIPYCGDRVLIMRDFRGVPAGMDIWICADYADRPSGVAASEIVALLESGEIATYNDPVWKE